MFFAFILHFVALPFLCASVLCPQTSFNSVFLCRLAAFVVRAMQETQPTRSKAKFQLNQRTVQTDGEPSKRTSEQTNEQANRASTATTTSAGSASASSDGRTRNNKLKLKFITHTHTRTTGRANMHTHRHAGAHVSFRFVRFCCWWVDWSPLLLCCCCGRRRCDACSAADSEVACAVLLLRVGGCWGGLVGWFSLSTTTGSSSAAAAATKNDGRLRKMLVFHLRKISHHFLALKTVRRAHGKGGMAAWAALGLVWWSCAMPGEWEAAAETQQQPR